MTHPRPGLSLATIVLLTGEMSIRSHIRSAQSPPTGLREQ
jgi:hypothetical protein